MNRQRISGEVIQIHISKNYNAIAKFILLEATEDFKTVYIIFENFINIYIIDLFINASATEKEMPVALKDKITFDKICFINFDENDEDINHE